MPASRLEISLSESPGIAITTDTWSPDLLEIDLQIEVDVDVEGNAELDGKGELEVNRV
jgi:hypothetical protein